MFKKIYTIFLAGLLLTGCTADNKKDVKTETTKLPVVESEEVVENKEKEIKETFRYLSKDYFYTDFEGESVVQTDAEIANTICQRNLNGELTDSYYMGEDFCGIFYVDENWLYYSEVGEGGAQSVYRVPFSHNDGKEYPEFSKKEFLFNEPDRMSYSDFTENPLIQIVDNTIYYDTIGAVGTYNLESREHKYYKAPGMITAGTHYMVVEKKNHYNMVNLETGKKQVIKTDTRPWLRLGKECYFTSNYMPNSNTGPILLDLNSGETIDVMPQEEWEQIAKEIGMPSDNEYEYITYIGYYNKRVYAKLLYTVTLMDKKGWKIIMEDAVCVSRNMDEEESWTIEKEITAHSRKKILEIYKKIKSGNYKIKRDSSYYDKELKIADYTEEIKMGEGITNGIFYFEGYYEKDGKMAIDIYDLDKKEFRIIGRNSLETFYPFYDKSYLMELDREWQNIRCIAPILSQGEEVWVQNQKLSGKYWEY